MVGDPRVFTTKLGDTIIFVNLKCGYASVNNFAKNYGIHDTILICPEDVQDAFRKAKTKILFVRDPKDRFLSFYRNWIINKRYDTSDNQTVFHHLEKYLSEADFKKIVSASAEEKGKVDFLNFFCSIISPFVFLERHMAPQFWLYQKFGLAPSDFSDITNYKNNVQILHELGATAKVLNKSQKEYADNLRKSNELDMFCHVIYAQDYRDLGAYF